MKEEKEDLFSARLKDAIAAMKPVRPVGRPRKIVAPKQQEVDITPHDEWDNETLSTEEQSRLARVGLPSSIHIVGSFATPTTIAKMFEAALDGRANTQEHLLKLHRHMTNSYSNGGVALASGALYTELCRILREEGATLTEKKRHNFLEDLESRK